MSYFSKAKAYIGRPLFAARRHVGTKRYERIYPALFIAIHCGFIASLLVAGSILLVQLSALSQIGSFFVFLGIACLLLLLAATTSVSKTILVVASIGIAALGFIIRWESLRYLNLRPISDLAITYDAAVSWTHGPHAVIHSFVFPHWGMYGLFLRDWFMLIGASVAHAKLLNLLAYLMVVASIALLCLKSSNRKPGLLAALMLVSLYPAFALYFNFLSGEMLFTGLASLATVSLLVMSKTQNIKRFYLYLVTFAVLLAFASMLKQMGIILLPLSLLCVILAIYKQPNRSKLLPGLVLLIIIQLTLPTIALHRLSHYAEGPANRHLTNLFLASGLSQRTNGQLDMTYYDPYLSSLTKAYKSHKLNDAVYVSENDKLGAVVQNELRDFWHLPVLFDQKLRFIWSNDNNMSVWFYTGSSENKKHAKAAIDLVSNIFYLTITVLFVLNIHRSIKQRDYEPVNVFCIFFVCLYILASMFIEGQARYRIILVPFLILGAAGGTALLRPLFTRLLRPLPDLRRR